MAISPDAKIPFIDKDDVGQVVASMFSNPTKYLRQRVQIAGDVASMREVAEIFSRVTGKHARFEEIPRVVRFPVISSSFQKVAYRFFLTATRQPDSKGGAPCSTLQFVCCQTTISESRRYEKTVPED